MVDTAMQWLINTGMLCELALLLAMDVSGSVTEANYHLQRDATASALEEVLKPRPGLPMAVGVIMWEGQAHVVLPWAVLRSQGDVQRFAARLRGIERPGGGSTNLTTAMQESLLEFDRVPCTPERRVLDISGDGASDEPDLDQQRQRAEVLEVQVNGLPIVTSLQNYDIVEYFRSEVITRDGFVVPATGWESYARAMRGKLALEIARR